jgi:hypothetical protein
MLTVLGKISWVEVCYLIYNRETLASSGFIFGEPDSSHKYNLSGKNGRLKIK